MKRTPFRPHNEFRLLSAVSTGYRVFIGLLLLLLLSGIYLQFSDIGKGTSLPRSFKELWNLGHIAFFAVMIYLLQSWGLLARFSLKTQWAIYLCLTFTIGLMIEYLQMGTHRSSDWMDVSRDMVGCLLVLAFAPSLMIRSVRLKTGLRIFVLVLLLIHLLPLKIALFDEALARQHFPVLADFSTPFELDRWSGSASAQVVQPESQHSDRQLKISLNTDRYSGFGLDYLVSDWRGFRYLKLEIYRQEPESLRIVVRIHDDQHEYGPNRFAFRDRYNQVFSLEQGWNLIKIPLQEVESAPVNRVMDMARISNVMLFASRLPLPTEIYLDRIYLSN